MNNPDKEYHPHCLPADAAAVELFDFGNKPVLGLRWGPAKEPTYRMAIELSIGALVALEQSCHAALRSLRNGDGYRAERDAKAGEK